MQSNLAQLTHAHSVVAAKKRAKREQSGQVVFDEDARRSVFISSSSFTFVHPCLGNFSLAFINESLLKLRLLDKKLSSERSRTD